MSKKGQRQRRRLQTIAPPNGQQPVMNCGTVGKITNCQHGVFAAYVSRSGYTFLDQRLYMPVVV
jgi:hypothetical protein